MWYTYNDEIINLQYYEFFEEREFMSLLSGIGKIRLNGKKELTKSKQVLSLPEPEIVYIPLIIGASTDFDVHVSEGDYVHKGTKLATRKDIYVPLYSPVSGTVKGIEKRMHTSGKIQNHLLIENDFKDDEVTPFSYDNPDSLSAEELVEAIKEIGILGLGGSGFPTYVKYQNAKNIEAVLINAVECEPYLTSDYKVMEKHSEELLDGTHFLMKAGHAGKGIIAVKVTNKDLILKLKEKAVKFNDIEIAGVPDAYPMGWERVLIREIFKKEYERFPSEIGIIVNNATTAIYLSEALRQKKAITHRIVTVSGEGIKNPENVYVPIGTSVDYIIDKIGGYNDKCEEIVVLAGGPMMGKSIANDQFVISSYSNSVTILPKKDTDEMPCLRCGLCVEYCPAKIQPVQIMNGEKMKDLDSVTNARADKCITCGLCSFICPSKIEVTDWVGKAKTRIANARKAGGK